MKVCIFTGPTISAAEAARELDAVYFPPAAEGDVYRASLQRPQVIGIIDGYFQDMPSVRLKEILWAMSRGIHVFGSASIGALRATELAAFGMEGVGEVFAAYRDGTLEEDDEVAVAHGLAETGYRPLSEAMVNIRATLAAAEAAGVLPAATRAAALTLNDGLAIARRAGAGMLVMGDFLRVLDLWANADPEVQPAIDRIRAALAKLDTKA